MSQSSSILIIDDNPSVHSFLRLILDGIQTESAYTGQSALNQLERQDYALIISDYLLPDMNGLDIISQLRRIKKEIPVMMFTANTNRLHPDSIYKLNVKYRIEKPLENTVSFKEKILAILMVNS